MARTLQGKAKEETAYGDADTLTNFSPLYRWETTMGEHDVTLRALLTFNQDTLKHICADTVSHTITIVTVWLSFPNVVTPNGDGTC